MHHYVITISFAWGQDAEGYKTTTATIRGLVKANATRHALFNDILDQAQFNLRAAVMDIPDAAEPIVLYYLCEPN